MGRTAIDEYLYLMDCAFAGDAAMPGRSWHAFLVNLASIPRDDWEWAPPNGNRTVLQFIEEVGGGKYVYDSQAFGDRSIHWDSVPAMPRDGSSEELIEWARTGYGRLRASIAALKDDTELSVRRLSPQGEMQETRWLIKTTLEHDIYHAGEINHIRALLQDTDLWPYQFQDAGRSR